MKKNINFNIERRVRNVVIATGIGSVSTQLFTIREFLSLLNGNEFVIALILFNWLFLSGIGTYLARFFDKRPSVQKFYWISTALIILAPIQLIGIRTIHDLIFIHGSSIGFYPTFAYIFFTIAPYSLLLGFALPYSLVVIRNCLPEYPGTLIYIFDNIGDIAGGVLFSFALVYFTTPLQGIFIAHLPLVYTLYRLYTAEYLAKKPAIIGLFGALTILILFAAFEVQTLVPEGGRLAYYQETPYGRIQIIEDRGQYTMMQNGRPMFSSQNLTGAEEAVHYPLAQLDSVRHVLMISAESLMMEEVEKYHPTSIDYVEIDPAITDAELRFGMIKQLSNMHVIHQDGRQYLQHTPKHYDAILVNLPEPDTFQINRFFTKQFFLLAKNHLTDKGVLSFSVKGFDNYLSDNELQKISSIYHTAQQIFHHILLIPGNRIFFLCSDRRLRSEIPELLENKNISTSYISGYYDGNISSERINRLNAQILPNSPINQDFSPTLVRILLDEWFAVFSTSPALFVILLGMANIIYFFYISKEEFVLYSTGFFTMGAEVLVIFAFQIFFGYIYFQIGLIVTVFLAGLFPGAMYGHIIRRRGVQILTATDFLLIFLMGLFICGIFLFPGHLSGNMFLVFGFLIALACGCQFPVALDLSGANTPAAVKMFSADLIGAAYGTLVTSILFIPFAGILWTAAGLIMLKLISAMILNVTK